MRPALPALLASLALPAAAETVTVTATLSYRERIALPPEARVIAELRDGARRLVGSASAPTGGAQVPLPLTVEAPGAEVLVLRAAILGAGAPFVTDAVVVARDGAVADAGALLARRAAEVAPARAWRCGETTYWLGWSEDGARLRRGGLVVALRADPAASGARAVAPDDPGTFAWSKGEDLTLSWRGAGEAACVPALDPLASGLSARGNEPGWRLEIGAEGIDFARLDTPGMRAGLPAPTLTEAGRLYAADGITVTLEDRVVRDDMSGMPHPVAVTVETAEGRFTGTGGDPLALLEGLDWRLAEIGGRPVDASVLANLRFEGTGVGGRGGCNRFSGSFELTGETLTIGPLAATMMACPGLQMSAERAFFSALGGVRGFDIDGEGALVLLGSDGPVARLLP